MRIWYKSRSKVFKVRDGDGVVRTVGPDVAVMLDLPLAAIARERTGGDVFVLDEDPGGIAPPAMADDRVPVPAPAPRRRGRPRKKPADEAPAVPAAD
jgi:hypothetical protein